MHQHVGQLREPAERHRRPGDDVVLHHPGGALRGAQVAGLLVDGEGGERHRLERPTPLDTTDVGEGTLMETDPAPRGASFEQLRRVVVEDLDDVIEFFTVIGLELEGRAMVEGEWAGRVTGVRDQRVEIAMMVTPDGQSRLELSRFAAPTTVSDHRTSPVNSLGYLRIMFTVKNLDELVSRLEKHGAELVGEIVQYEDIYRLCYVRGPEGILVALSRGFAQASTAACAVASPRPWFGNSCG